MRIILKNASMVFKAQAPVIYSSSLHNGLYCGSIKVLAPADYKIWAFKNESNNSQTWRVFNAKSDKFGNNFVVMALADTMPLVDIPITDTIKGGTVAEADFDATIVVPSGKYLLVSDYGFAYSSDRVPDVSVDGEVVPLPTA